MSVRLKIQISALGWAPVGFRVTRYSEEGIVVAHNGRDYRVLGSRLLAALAFDHRRGIHGNIEDVLDLVPQYFVVSIS